MLDFEESWRFTSPGEVPEEACREIFAFACTTAKLGERWQLFEMFKMYFAQAAGVQYFRSSDSGWAKTHLEDLMFKAAKNAPLFIEAFWDACDEARQAGAAGPDADALNRVLAKHRTGFEVHPPRLIRSGAETAPEPVRAKSIGERADGVIQDSLKESERLLSEGRNKQAVQEVLWLLETVSTAFKGTGTSSGSVEGKYFVRIVKDLRKLHRGNTLEQVLKWIEQLYGYLSSPTGGGVRHGTDIADPKDLEDHEARLFCHLVREYIRFLLAAHERYGERSS